MFGEVFITKLIECDGADRDGDEAPNLYLIMALL